MGTYTESMVSGPRVHSFDSLGIVEIKMDGLDLMKTKGYERSNLVC
jgi:hypothetical protein